MNYIGGKLSLLDFIDDSVEKITGGNYDSVCDIFAGTGIVGRHFKNKGKKIISNDLQFYSYALNRHYIGNTAKMSFSGLKEEIPNLAESQNAAKTVCEYLLNVEPQEGFVYKNYCLGGSNERMYFSDENGMICDTVRIKIDEWLASGKITEDEYFYLLCTLLEGIDKVANTASVYGAFLKNLKKSATKKIALEPVDVIESKRSDHVILNLDANDVVRKHSMDVLYMDPPYNQRQYATNYHMLETIAKNDNPEIHGKTGLRDYSKQKSLYCSRNKVKETFRDLIMNADAKYILLSYNNEGLMSFDDIREVMSAKGEYGFFTKEYRRFKADTKRDYSADKTTEYLHYVICK